MRKELLKGKIPLSFYKAILEGMGEGVLFIDMHRQILYWSKGAENLLGYKGGEVVGNTCFNKPYRVEDYEDHCVCTDLCPLMEALRKWEEEEVRLFFYTKDGKRKPFDAKIFPTNLGGTLLGGIIVLRDATIKKKLEEYGLMDPLTRLPSRRQIELLLVQEGKRFRRKRNPFCLIMADIDHFKQVNDNYGHEKGDEILRGVAHIIHQNIREQDCASRYGGEEFLILVPETKLQDATVIGERLREAVEESTLAITISLGVAQIGEREGIKDLVRRTDRALYRAKEKGRNRVEIDPL